MKNISTLKNCLIFLLLIPLSTSLVPAAYASTHPTQRLAPFQQDSNNDKSYTATIGHTQYHITLTIPKNHKYNDENATLTFTYAEKQHTVSLKRAFNANCTPNVMAWNQDTNTWLVLFKSKEQMLFKMYRQDGNPSTNALQLLKFRGDDIEDAKDIKICYLKYYHNPLFGIIYYTYLKENKRYFGLLFNDGTEGLIQHRQLSSSPNRFCVIASSEEQERLEHHHPKILSPIILTQAKEKAPFSKAEAKTPIAAKQSTLPYAEDKANNKVIVFESDQMLEAFPKQIQDSTFIAGYLGQHDEYNKIYTLFYQAKDQESPYTWYSYQVTQHAAQEEQQHAPEDNTTLTKIHANIASITYQPEKTFVITPDAQRIFCFDKKSPTQPSYIINTAQQPTSPWRHIFFRLPLYGDELKTAWLYSYNAKEIHITTFPYNEPLPLKQQALRFPLKNEGQINKIIYDKHASQPVYILLTKQRHNIVKQLKDNNLIEVKNESWITLKEQGNSQQDIYVSNTDDRPKIEFIGKSRVQQYYTLGKSIPINWGDNTQPSPIKFFWKSPDSTSFFFSTEDKRVFEYSAYKRHFSAQNVSGHILLYWVGNSLYCNYNKNNAAELYHIPQAHTQGLYKKCDTYSALKTHTIVNIVKNNKQPYVVLKSKTNAKNKAPEYYVVPLAKKPIAEPQKNEESPVIAVDETNHNLIAKIDNVHWLISLKEKSSDMIKLEKTHTHNNTEVWTSKTDNGNTNIYMHIHQTNNRPSIIKQVPFPKAHEIISLARKEKELLLLVEDTQAKDENKRKKVMYSPNIVDPTKPIKTMEEIKDKEENPITPQNIVKVYTAEAHFQLPIGWFITYSATHMNYAGSVITCTLKDTGRSLLYIYKHLLHIKAMVRNNPLTSLLILFIFVCMSVYLYSLYIMDQHEENHTDNTYRRSILAQQNIPIPPLKQLGLTSPTTTQAQPPSAISKKHLFGLMMLLCLIGLAIAGISTSMRRRKPLS